MASKTTTTAKAKTDQRDNLAKLEPISAAVEAGAGLPAVVRAVATALDASFAVIDAEGSVVAVAAASPEDERRLIGADRSVQQLELRVADRIVGSIKLRARGDAIEPYLLRVITTLLALETDRALAPDRADQEVSDALIEEIVHRRLLDPQEITQRAASAGIDIAQGAGFVIARVAPRQATSEDWRAQLSRVVDRAIRAVSATAVAARIDRPNSGTQAEVFVLVPGPDDTERVANAISVEMQANLSDFATQIGFGRATTDPADLYRSSQEALLAANVAASGRQHDVLAFEQTGAYRLLLHAMCDDPDELRRFYSETIEPLVAYDEQYETELVQTVETFLDADGNVAGAAQRLFTHRHTVRYRLDRVRELTGLDCSSTDGREKLGLGLKSMRVLGITKPHGPATERGTHGGRVPPGDVRA